MNFEDKLLVRLHAESARRRTRRTAFRTAGVTGVLTAAAASALAIGDVAVNPRQAAAYSITQNPDSITIKIRDMRDAAKLEADLAKRGVKVSITYLPDGKGCRTDRYPPDPRTPKNPKLGDPMPEEMNVADPVDQDRITIYPGRLPSGYTLVLDFAHEGDPPHGTVRLDGFIAVAKVVKPCVLVPVPAMTFKPGN